MTSAIVIVGGGQAAAVAARTLRRRGFDGRIEIVGDEPDRPYQRPPLTKEFLTDGAEDGLFLLGERWCEANDVRLRLGQPAVRIWPDPVSVELADGSEVPADAVLLATGGRPRRLPGVSGERVCYLRTLRDARFLRERLRAGPRLVVVGAGFLGSEVAAAARAHGAEVTVVEAQQAPLHHLLGATVGAACAELHRANGVDLRLGETVRSVTETADGVVVTTSGGRVEGDLVVVGVGITPNTEVAERSGIAVDNGVVVDEHCRTSLAGVYAAGDVANHFHPLYGERVRVEHFDNASRQAAAAADNLLGRATVHGDPHWFWSDQYDVNLQYTGHAPRWDEVVVRGSVEDLDFCAFYLRDGLVRAAFGIDRGGDVAAARELMARRVPVAVDVLRDDDADLAELGTLQEQR